MTQQWLNKCFIKGFTYLTHWLNKYLWSHYKEYLESAWVPDSKLRKPSSHLTFSSASKIKQALRQPAWGEVDREAGRRTEQGHGSACCYLSGRRGTGGCSPQHCPVYSPWEGGAITYSSSEEILCWGISYLTRGDIVKNMCKGQRSPAFPISVVLCSS